MSSVNKKSGSLMQFPRLVVLIAGRILLIENLVKKKEAIASGIPFWLPAPPKKTLTDINTSTSPKKVPPPPNTTVEANTIATTTHHHGRQPFQKKHRRSKKGKQGAKLDPNLKKPLHNTLYFYTTFRTYMFFYFQNNLSRSKKKNTFREAFPKYTFPFYI